MRLAYVIGEPGAGKSTLVGLVLQQPLEVIPKPFRHARDASGLICLGDPGAEFPGTDTLSLSVQPRALEWLEATRPERVIGEGDRLATSGFLAGACVLGYEVTLVHLATPEALAALRREQRAGRLGRPVQSASWVAGRRTKVARLVAGWGGPLLVLDGRRPPHDLAAELASVV